MTHDEHIRAAELWLADVEHCEPDKLSVEERLRIASIHVTLAQAISANAAMATMQATQSQLLKMDKDA